MGVRRQVTEQYFRQLLAQAGMPFMGEIRFGFVPGSSSNNFEAWLESDMDIPAALKHQGAATALIDGENELTANRNDALILLPGAFTGTAAITWDKSNTHLIGAHSPSPWTNSTKITYSGSGSALSPFVTVSGSDCLIRNIHFVDAGSHANHHIFLKNTGSGNMFENCWFEGPTNATQADDTSYTTVQVDGGGNYFKNCAFGSTAVDTNGARKLGFTGSAYRTTFEDCIFYHQASGTSACFIEAATSFDFSGPQFFKNCIFVSWWSNQADRAAVAIAGGCRTGMLIFDANCIFTGCDAVATAGTEAIVVGHPLTADHDGTKAGIVENVSGTRP